MHPSVGEDVVLGDLSVLENRPFPAGKLFPIEPVVDEAFQCDMDAFAGQAGVDLGQRFFDPVVAFLLGLAVLRQTVPFQADLCAPETILAAVKRTLMVSSSSCHVQVSFLSMQTKLWNNDEHGCLRYSLIKVQAIL
jgi:hypothetical protein